MNCYSHQSTAAVGICRACGKGVCPRCAADTGVGIGCRDVCEDRVLILGRMVTDNERVMRAANAQVRSGGLYGVLTGILFVGVGVWAYTSGSLFTAVFLGGMGVLLLLFGLVRLTFERYPTPRK